MSDIPRSPATFFRDYVPAALAGLGAEFSEHSSPGAIVFEIGSEAWSLRLTGGSVVVEPGVAIDTLLRMTLSAEDFVPVIVAGAERLDGQSGLERGLVAGRALSIDVERARMLRESGGTVLLKLASGAASHRVAVSLGGSTPKLEAPDCVIECALEDLWGIQSGTANPFQLLLDGKIRLQGNAELALAMAAALG